MTVVNPKSISGINSITTGSGSDNLLTIHTSDANNTERVRVNSSGDVIVGSGVTLSPDGNIFATGVTTSTTFVGALTGNVTGNISGGTVAGSTGTFTGDVDIADKIIHTGDTNTAIRFPTADTITAETGGSERVRITSAGLMGIGTNNPAFQLDVDYSSGEDGIRILNRGTTSGSTSMLRLGNDENINAAFLMLNSSGYSSVGGAYNLVLGHGLNRDIVFATGGAEKLRIDSSGRLLMGGATSSHGSSNADDLQIGANNQSNQTGITLGSASASSVRFADASDDTAGQIYYSHSDNTMRFTTASSERVRIDADGIKFNGDSAAANGLDDYEEGYWSPTAVDGMTLHLQDSGNVPCRRYVKIGRQVTCFFDINFDSGNSSANFRTRFGGLPFSVETGGHQAAAAVVFGFFDGDNSEGEGLMAHISSGLVSFFEDGNELWSYSKSAGDRIAGYFIYTTT